MSRYTQHDLRKNVQRWNEEIKDSNYQFSVQCAYNMTSLLIHKVQPDGAVSTAANNIQTGSPRECWQAGNRVLGNIIDNSKVDDISFKLNLALESMKAGSKWKTVEFVTAALDELQSLKTSI